MPKFKRGAGAHQSNSGGFQETNLVLRADAGATWIKSYLKDGNTTRFRIVPAFDPETGEEELALNPEATPDMEFEDIFGPVIFKAEVTDAIGTNNATFISGVSHDRAGNPVTDGWSPTKVMLRRLRYKLEEAEILQSAGRTSDIPQEWRRWLRRANRMTKLPSELLLMQVMVCEYNGEVKQDLKSGETDWIFPACIAIPRTAQPTFLTDAKTKENLSKDLSASNNLFGDFCSVAGGHNIMLRKLAPEKEDDKNTYNLRLVELQALDEEEARDISMPWEEMVHIPTVEDTIEWLVESFDGTAVDFGLRGSSYEQYIPEECIGSASMIADCVNLKDLRAQLAGGTSQGGGAATPPAYAPPGGAAPAGRVRPAAVPRSVLPPPAGPPVNMQEAQQAFAQDEVPPWEGDMQDADVIPPNGDYQEDTERFNKMAAKIKKPR